MVAKRKLAADMVMHCIFGNVQISTVLDLAVVSNYTHVKLEVCDVMEAFKKHAMLAVAVANL